MILTLLAAIAAAGCGGEDRGISDAASGALQSKVAEVRSRAAARDANGLNVSVTELRTMVEQFHDDGEISDSVAEDILTAAAAVTANVATITTTTTAPPPPSEDDDEDKDDDEDSDETGRGKGRKSNDG